MNKNIRLINFIILNILTVFSVQTFVLNKKNL